MGMIQKQNEWYIEQMKLSQKEKFGVFSEKTDENQMTLFDFFNETEILREQITTELNEKVLVPTHTKRKAKRGSRLDVLPVESTCYEILESDKICKNCGSVLPFVIRRKN